MSQLFWSKPTKSKKKNIKHHSKKSLFVVLSKQMFWKPRHVCLNGVNGCMFMCAKQSGIGREIISKKQRHTHIRRCKNKATGASSDLYLKRGICEWWRWSWGPPPPPAGLSASAEASWGSHCAGASWSAHAGSGWAWPWSSSYTAHNGSSRHHPPPRFRAAAGAVGGDGEREREREKERKRLL